MIKNSLPDSSRVWVYQSDSPFSDEQCLVIEHKLQEFLATWNYHGVDLQAAGEVINNQFIVLFVDEQVQGAGGCSIDKSVALIKSIEKDFGVDLMNRMNIAYKDSGKIQVKRMSDFQSDIKLGLIDESTTVYNNLVQTKGEFIASWEGPLKDSWHKQLL